MSKIDDGGPAFPSSIGKDVAEGMSLRDYAAIHMDISQFQFGSLDDASAMFGIPAPTTNAEMIEFGVQISSLMRLRLADAFIAARKREG